MPDPVAINRELNAAMRVCGRLDRALALAKPSQSVTSRTIEAVAVAGKIQTLADHISAERTGTLAGLKGWDTLAAKIVAGNLPTRAVTPSVLKAFNTATRTQGLLDQQRATLKIFESIGPQLAAGNIPAHAFTGPDGDGDDGYDLASVGPNEGLLWLLWTDLAPRVLELVLVVVGLEGRPAGRVSVCAAAWLMGLVAGLNLVSRHPGLNEGMDDMVGATCVLILAQFASQAAGRLFDKCH